MTEEQKQKPLPYPPADELGRSAETSVPTAVHVYHRSTRQAGG
jgi:hypothetical protein